ncbi:hypothetical protein DL95DRAFT_386539, partial [Leptodontidium sp. 2 PMI_412]
MDLGGRKHPLVPQSRSEKWDESTVKQRAWSRWIWEEHNSRYYRSRQKDSGEEWEFEYDYKTD